MTPGTDPVPTGPPAPPGFFDDDYRRLLEPFHSEAAARHETAALREILALAQDDRILDLGCGWGRHLTLLAEAGHDVTGLDLSLHLLRQVPATPAADGPARRPPLVAADMRAVPFADAAFDVVLNLATSLGLFLHDDDALAALREVRRLLKPRGRFLLEGMHRDDVEANFAPRARWLLDDGTQVRARRRWDPARGISEEVLRWKGPGGEGEKRHSLRIRSAVEARDLLEAADLDLTGMFGDWDFSTFSVRAPRLIAVCERRPTPPFLRPSRPSSL